PGPCIHYIWSPTVHITWKCNYFSKYKLLNTFSHQQLEQSCDFYQCPAEHWLKLVGGVFLFCSRRMQNPLHLSGQCRLALC
ncbi:unnamed protein product, partial [Staurois parvus]